MREIKFRAWFKVQKKMVYNLGFDQFSFRTLEELEGTEYMPSVYDMDAPEYDENDELTGYEGTFNFKIMQYTGLKDKNGKEIYEGDIIQDERGKKYLIKWGINSNGFIAKTNETHCNVYSSYHLSFKTQVIGNIHDNPELLEVV